MIGMRGLDCLTIGYNDPPFEEYERLIRRYGEDSEAYRDLKFSFVEVDGRKLNYVDLLNTVMGNAGHDGAALASGEIPNLAAVYLTNYLRRRGLAAEYVNLYQLEKDRLAAILDEDPLVVAITTTFYVVNFPVTEMVEFIRQRNAKVKIVVGGPLVANHTRNYRGEDLQAALRDIGADVYIVESQGETTLTQLIHALRAGADLSGVPNIYYLEGGRYAATTAMPESNDMDENYIDWQALASGDLGPTLQTRTARSCAFKCAFCNYPTRAGALTLASLDAMEREFDSMARRGNVQNVVFIDDTFNVPLPRFKEICRLLIRKQYGFKWFSYFRCSNSDEEAVELMAQSGCAGVFLGIESGSPAILKNMAKAAKIEQYARGIEMLRRHGVLTFGSFIIGFPGETEETVQETLDFINDTKVDYFRAQMWYNEAGTPIHDQRDRFNIMGDGFVWSHATMDSLEAMEHIERLFLRVSSSEWLPQWSFDFWIIPYLMGKGISRERFREFMHHANQMLRLEIAAVERREKERLSRQHMRELVDKARAWSFAQA
jgi:radical SAM PhpK family P-methyltransferase